MRAQDTFFTPLYLSDNIKINIYYLIPQDKENSEKDSPNDDK
jgi:hypothetical protein